MNLKSPAEHLCKGVHSASLLQPVPAADKPGHFRVPNLVRSQPLGGAEADSSGDHCSLVRSTMAFYANKSFNLSSGGSQSVLEIPVCPSASAFRPIKIPSATWLSPLPGGRAACAERSAWRSCTRTTTRTVRRRTGLGAR